MSSAPPAYRVFIARCVPNRACRTHPSSCGRGHAQPSRWHTDCVPIRRFPGGNLVSIAFSKRALRCLSVFPSLNTFQQRVISSSEIIFKFEPRSVKHSCTATARVGVGLSKSRDGICEFRPEASAFHTLLLEIASQFRIMGHACACRYPVSPSRQVSMSV